MSAWIYRKTHCSFSPLGHGSLDILRNQGCHSLGIKKYEITFASFFTHFPYTTILPVSRNQSTNIYSPIGKQAQNQQRGKGYNHSEWLKIKLFVSHHEKTISYSG